MIMEDSPAVWYFLDIKPPFMGVWFMAVPASFHGLRYGLFYFCAKPVKMFRLSTTKYTYHFSLIASGFYFPCMQKKKPGPRKGRKHADIKRSAFGERLFKTRRIRGLSQTELGKRVGISRRMVCHYEGDAPEGPPLTTLNKIAEALNVTVSYLLGESTQKAIKDDARPIEQKHFRMIQELPTKEQRKVFEYVEMLTQKQTKKNGEDK